MNLRTVVALLSFTVVGLGVGTEIGFQEQHKQGEQIKELTTKVDNLAEKLLTYEQAAHIQATLEKGQQLAGKALKAAR